MKNAETKSHTQRVVERLVLLFILGVVSYFAYSARQLRNPNGPPGEVLPSLPPSESNRVTFASGASMILPENWEYRDLSGKSHTNFSIYPRQATKAARRHQIVLLVTEKNVEVDAKEADSRAGFTPSRFLDYPAWERISIREGTFDEPTTSTYTLFVNQNDRMWQIECLIHKRIKSLPLEILQYLETIQFS